MKTGDQKFRELGFFVVFETVSSVQYEKRYTEDGVQIIERITVMEPKSFFERFSTEHPDDTLTFTVGTDIMDACLTKSKELRGRRICRGERP